MSEHSDQELIEILRKTKEKFGPLYPVLQDADGNIIDGKHRIEADPLWPTVTVDWLKSDVDYEALRLISNWIRREVPPFEKRESLAKIAELTGWTPKEVSDNLGISYRTVMLYIPDEYKQRPGAGGPKSRVASLATQGIAVPAGRVGVSGSEVEDKEAPATPLDAERHIIAGESEHTTDEIYGFLERYYLKVGTDTSLAGLLKDEIDSTLEQAVEWVSKWRQSRALGIKLKPDKDPFTELVDRLSKYYPPEIMDDVFRVVPARSYGTLLKYLRKYIYRLHLNAPPELRQKTLQEVIR